MERIPRIRAGDASIPAIGFGTWQLTGRVCGDRVRDALVAGYRHIDTAQMYANEHEVGRGLRESGVDRGEVFLTTKLWIDNLARDAVLSSTDESLTRLQTDYLDLLLIHWPSEDVPLAETLGAMRELQEAGRVRHLGVSNFPPSWLERALGETPLVCDQVECHPLLGQERLLASVRRHGLALVAYSPLAHGDAVDEKALAEIGERHGKSPAQVALRWLVQQEGVAAIPKASRPGHLRENLDVFDFELSPAEMERIAGLARGQRVVDPELAPDWEDA